MKPDAVNDIMMNPRFEGAIDTISTIVSFLDGAFAFFITIIAFFIISSALMRNVVAGAYAAWPIFFDKVHAVREAAMAKKDQSINIGGRAVKAGAIMYLLAWCIPDFKELSEFRDETIRPRDYFIKAIPQMFGVVMIGVVIYNGYYRDVTSKVATLGSEIIVRTLLAVDPIKVFDDLTNSVGTPGTSSELDNSMKGKLTESITKGIYSGVISYWSDVDSKEAKSALMVQLEDKVSSELQLLDSYMDPGVWKAKFQVDRILGAFNASKIVSDEDKPDSIMKGFSVTVSELGLDSGLHQGEDWRYRVIIRFDRVYKGASKVTGATLKTTSNIKIKMEPEGSGTLMSGVINKSDIFGGLASNISNISGEQGVTVTFKDNSIVDMFLVPQSDGNSFRFKQLGDTSTKDGKDVASLKFNSNITFKAKDKDGKDVSGNSIKIIEYGAGKNVVVDASGTEHEPGIVSKPGDKPADTTTP